MPELYIIRGFNGAHKSTVHPDYLASLIQQNALFFSRYFFNGRGNFEKSASKSSKKHGAVLKQETAFTGNTACHNPLGFAVFFLNWWLCLTPTFPLFPNEQQTGCFCGR
jgi:hypothetical protein